MEKSSYWPSLCLQKILLPFTLIISCCLRQNGLSLSYLFLLLCNPFVPVANRNNITTGITGHYLIVNMMCPVLNLCAQILFQIILIANEEHRNMVEPLCGYSETLLRHIGLISMRDLHIWPIIQIIFPDIILILSSIIIYSVCRVLHRKTPLDENLLPIITAATISHHAKAGSSQRRFSILTTLGKYVCIFSICMAGIIQPSVPGSVYFLFFLVCMTCWAYKKNLGRAFAIVCCFILFIINLHIIAIFCYQTQWAQEYLPEDSIYARFAGLVPLFVTDCYEPRLDKMSNAEWTSFANPLILIWLYFILSFETNVLLRPQLQEDKSKEDGMSRQLSARLSQRRLLRNQTNRWRTATRKVRLIRGRESRKGRARAYIQDSHGSVTMSDDYDDSTRLEDVPEEDKEGDASQGNFEIVVNVIIAIGQLLTQSSYILTIITMMAWSITYHSWLTFVLLLWASSMWMLPNQRRAMLRSSPFLVFYSMILLIVQYIYGMNVSDAEIPQEIRGFNLKQIGFEKHSEYAVTPLLIKTLYTLMFWVTLRQYNQEKWEARNTSALAEIVAPLQVGDGSPTETGSGPKTGQFIQKLGKVVRSFLTKYWIWVVAIFLFSIGITGERMTIFRIIYMALALVFILTFQLSWTLWRKIMYGFWLTVIMYSMLILVLTYTYQFDNFDKYWEEYLHVDKKLQLDIGLERFETTELFVRLLTPTIFVIVSVIQLYYFHKDFLAISDIKSRGTSSVRHTVTSSRRKRWKARRSTAVSETDNVSDTQGPMSSTPSSESEEEHEKCTEGHGIFAKFDFSQAHFKRLMMSLKHKVEHFIEMVWLYLELHMLKIIMFVIMMVAVYDVCALHVALILLAVLSVTFGVHIQTLCAQISSVLVSIFLLAKMVYQIEYIDHHFWDGECNYTNGRNTTTPYNSAEWLGFEKTSSEKSLIQLLYGYIGIILVVTLHTVVTTRQKYKRHLKGRSLSRPLYMFSRITYRDVDRDITHCLKYLMNYGFYRFGVEICLIAMIVLISIRMDIMAVLYALWMCVVISPNRTFLSRIWGIFTLFIVATVPLQYLVVIGIPPAICHDFHWNISEIKQRFQEWMFLPDPFNPPPATKIISDYIVLMLVCRQAIVFRIEKRYKTHGFAGGTNASIIAELEQPDFIIPVPDFMTHIKSHLDVVKRIIMKFFIWVTLIFVFLAGTNRVNVFSLGYLIGSFIFFWQGNDLYLRPMKVILKWWKCMIAYNVTVILLKTTLQIAGCIFIKEMMHTLSLCWLVELFGIGCIKKFKSSFPPDIGKCALPEEEAGLAWDGFCFVFLILQRRLFNSYYFQHVVNETKAMAILASRGAELIQELSVKQIREQQETERMILEKIKYKMDRIKASQQRVQGQGPEYKEPPNHHAAVRSGDYYMFEDMDEELDLIEEQKSDTSEELQTRIPSVTQRPEDGREPHQAEEPRPGPSTETLLEETAAALRVKKDDSDEDDKKDDGDDKRKDKDSDEDSDSKEAKASFILFIKFLWTLIVSVIVTITKVLNRISRDYRFIMRILSIEKKMLKSKIGFGQGIRVSGSMMWHPTPYIVSSKPRLTAETLEDIEEEKERSAMEKSLIIQFVLAVWYALISHSELVCYCVIFIHQINSATLLSLPLPLMVFLWGTLTVPRPTKNFWISIISYTQTVIIIKYLFQFKILSWDEQAPDNRPFFLPRIIGIERKPHFASYDLALLLIVFAHRSMLKSLGLWKTSEEDTTPKSSDMELEHHPPVHPAPSDMAMDIVHKPSMMTMLKGFFQKKTESRPTLSTEVGDDQSSTRAGDDESFQDIQENIQEKNTIGVRYQVESPLDYFPNIIPLTASRYLSPAKGFFKSLLEPSIKVTADVYAYMFFCDFFNLLVVIFGFASFGSQQGDGGVSQYIEENRVPVAFLVMLILQFLLIIIDRFLYLRKFVLGKIIFQFGLVFGIHIWMFFILPAVTDRQFNAKMPPQLWYIVKCLYLLFSAYQIRSGYPTRILGNFLCKSYNYINMWLFRVFMLVPFVFELRALMDWIWTDTSMTLPDWLKMEDIFAHIFMLKCQRRAETEYPQARGEKKVNSSKYIVGGSCLLMVIGVIWFPLVWFALGNTVGEPNLPYEVSVSVRIGGYQPIYSMAARNNSIHRLTENDWETITTVYKKSRTAQTFLSIYGYQDIGVVQFSSHSTSIWTISPPDLKNLIREAESSNPMTIKMDWSVIKKTSNPEEPSQLNAGEELTLEADDPNRKNLVDLLLDRTGAKPMFLKNIFPKFLKVTNRGTVNPQPQLMSIDDEIPPGNRYRNVAMTLNRSVTTGTDNTQVTWWVLKEDCSDEIYKTILSKLPFQQSCDNVIMYTFNDKAFPPSFNFISGKGIIGMYTTFVIVVHSFIRGFFTGISFRIMFDDMPNVDRVLQLCLDIYLVRESGELDLEEDLFAKLVFLYRSPETLIKWTRPPEEVPPDEEEDVPPLEN